MKTSSSEAFTFDDVLILPAASSRVKSRKDVDTSAKLGPFKLGLPIFTASMAVFDTNYAGNHEPNPKFARAVSEAGGAHIQSRGINTPFEPRFEMCAKLAAEGVHIGMAVSLTEFRTHKPRLMRTNGLIVSIDIANGAILEDEDVTDWENHENILMAGNFGTPKAVQRFIDARQRLIQKYSVGSGSACTTRGVTGIGSPNAWLVEQVAGNSRNHLCIDGGIKGTADFCKALALGANVVMMGRPFAGALETCSPIYAHGGEQFKDYFGMASAKAKGNSEFVEGTQGRVRYAGEKVAEVFKAYEQALRSAMSYVDAFTLLEYRQKAEVIRVSGSTQLENSTRLDALVVTEG